MNSIRNAFLLAVLFPAMGCMTARAYGQSVNETTQRLYEDAKNAERANHLDEAIRTYQKMVELSPGLAAAHSNLGRLYFGQADYDKAIQSLRRACQLDPKLAAPRALLGFSYFQMEDFEASRRELTVAAHLDPHDAEVKLFLARSLVETGDLKSALKLLQALQEQDAHNVEVLYTLGLVYSSMAESTLSTIQSYDPNSYLVDLLLGKAAEAKGTYTDAAEHYKNAAEKAPDNWQLHYKYGHALFMIGQIPEALVAYRRALSLNPYAYDACVGVASIVLTQDPGEALSLATKALDVKPDLPDALLIRGRALLALDRPKEAVADLKRACALDPEDYTSHFQLARAYRKLGMAEDVQKEDSIVERIQRETHERSEDKLRRHLDSSSQSPQKSPRPVPQ